MNDEYVNDDTWESIKDFFRFMLVVVLIWVVLFVFLGCAHADVVCPIAGPEGQGNEAVCP